MKAANERAWASGEAAGTLREQLAVAEQRAVRAEGRAANERRRADAFADWAHVLQAGRDGAGTHRCPGGAGQADAVKNTDAAPGALARLRAAWRKIARTAGLLRPPARHGPDIMACPAMRTEAGRRFPPIREHELEHPTAGLA